MSGQAPRRPNRPPDRFTPKEQAVAVWLGHSAILVVVTLIMAFGVSEVPPWLFFAAEGTIWVMFATLVFDFGDICEFIVRFVPRARQTLGSLEREWARRGPPIAFAVAFILQYVALTPLLTETGGPIDSPFAQLVIAFAVFTPVLANESRTMLFALVLSLAYYGAMVAEYGFGASTARPSPGVFFAVTALILVVTVVLTVLDRNDGDRRYRQWPTDPDTPA